MRPIRLPPGPGAGVTLPPRIDPKTLAKSTPVVGLDRRASAATSDAHKAMALEAVSPVTTKPRAASVPALLRSLAASSFDIERAIDKLVTSGPSPFADRVRSSLRAAAPIQIASAPEPRRAESSIRLAALLTALLPEIDAKGELDFANLRRIGGASIATVLEAYAARKPPRRTNFLFLGDVVQVLKMTLPREPALAVVNAFMRDDTILPKKLAPLEAVKALVPNDRFADEGLIAAQHLLPTSVALYEALIEKGMAPERMHILGTPYASNPLVIAVLLLMGVDAQPGRDPQLPTMGFEEYRLQAIHQFLMTRAQMLFAQRPPGGYQVLDDGGLLQLAAGGDKLPQMPEDTKPKWVAALNQILGPSTRVVEQTTRGITEVSKKGPAFHTVSVAKCEAKRREGKIIGHALVDALITILAQRDRLGPARVAVVSGGTVGLATAQELRDVGFEAMIVDGDGKKREAASALGFVTAESVDAAVKSRPDVLYPCTGMTSASGEALVDFDGLILSGSSMAVEGYLPQIGSFRRRPLDYANRFRPANFDGTGHENVSPAQIGITRALLFAALAQPATSHEPEFVDVDATMQQVALEAWVKSGGDRVEISSLSVRDDSIRPDAQGNATCARHDEWLAFLAGLLRPVCPRPTEMRRAALPYFFADVDGSVRLIDTRVDGTSRAVQLPSVPRLVEFTSRAPGAPLLAVCKGELGDELFEVTLGPSPRVRALGPVDYQAALFLHQERPDGFHVEGEACGYAFLSGSELLVRTARTEERAEKYVRLSLPGDLNLAATHFKWVHQGVIVAVDKSTGKVHPLLVDDTREARQVAERVGLPATMKSVVALVHWNDTSALVHPLVAIGRDENGGLCAAVISPAVGTEVVLLPEGAILRNLRQKPLPHAGVFVIEYTLPGDPVEAESFRQMEIDAFANVRSTDVVASTLEGRLR